MLPFMVYKITEVFDNQIMIAPIYSTTTLFDKCFVFLQILKEKSEQNVQNRKVIERVPFLRLWCFVKLLSIWVVPGEKVPVWGEGSQISIFW